CGAFGDLSALDEQQFCSACAARPEVGAVDKFRRANLGKRDLWAWLIGIDAIYGIVIAALHAAQSGDSANLGGRLTEGVSPHANLVIAAALLAISAIQVSFWL